MSAPIRTSLSRHICAEPADEVQIQRWATQAWIERGCLVVYEHEITNPLEAAAVRNIGNRKYGKRKGNP